MPNVNQRLSKTEVARTAEFKRICALPRRKVSKESVVKLASEMTALLKEPFGQMDLRPLQAQALAECVECEGAFCNIRVGGGKTLLSLLIPTVLGSTRAVLILPAALIAKTEKERHELSKHFKVSRSLRVLSYEQLGRVSGVNLLEFYQPDLFIFDECHRLKNKRAGVTRRILRYFQSRPQTRAVAMSGTIIKHSLKDFAHILAMTHGQLAPVPLNEEVDVWSSALENDFGGAGSGALGETVDEAREWFRGRLVETPGVVVSHEKSTVDASILIKRLKYDFSAVTKANLQKLYEEWETPDGWPLCEAVDIWRHAREISVGFHGVWDPRPPEAWIIPRKSWAKFVRETISRSRHLDTELQVALEAAKAGTPEYMAWKEVKESFVPNPKPVWHDDSALLFCKKWLEENAGICWVAHTFFAEKLARMTGLPYFGPGGMDSNERTIESAEGPIIASIAANSQGRNLQRWSVNLVTAAPAGADAWEQLIGRTHREGQRADTVSFDVMIGCKEHDDALDKAIDGARMIHMMTGNEQKLLLADHV